MNINSGPSVKTLQPTNNHSTEAFSDKCPKSSQVHCTLLNCEALSVQTLAGEDRYCPSAKVKKKVAVDYCVSWAKVGCFSPCILSMCGCGES